MRFCRRCGATVAVFPGAGDDCCAGCRNDDQRKTSSERSGGDQDLLSAVVQVVDDKLVLLSREGWLLWSGSPREGHSLGDILQRAGRILDIRTRRKN